MNHFQILLTLSRIDSTTRFIVLYTIYIHKHVRIYRKRRRRKKKNDTRFSPRISNFRYFCIASFAVIRITKNSRTSVCPIASFRNALLEPEVEENSKRELWKSLVGLRTSGAALENQTTLSVYRVACVIDLPSPSSVFIALQAFFCSVEPTPHEFPFREFLS